MNTTIDLTQINKELEEIVELLNKELKTSPWLSLNGGEWFYHREVHGIFPNLKTFHFPAYPLNQPFPLDSYLAGDIAGMVGRLMSYSDFRAVFEGKITEIEEYFDMEFNLDVDFALCDEKYYYVCDAKGKKGTFGEEGRYKAARCIPLYSFEKAYERVKKIKDILFCVQSSLIPDCLNERQKKLCKLINEVMKVVNKNLIVVRENKMFLSKLIFMSLEDKYAQNSSVKKLEAFSLLAADKEAEPVKIITPKEQPPKEPKIMTKIITKAVDEEELTSLEDELLNVDYLRCGLPSYDLNLLTDINRGHWDLCNRKKYNPEKNEQVKALVPRIPLKDICKNGIVGIDFGAKSTVMLYQNRNDYILPIYVGEKNIEHPTIIELNALESFMESYEKKDGRPDTRWEDVLISHQAANDFLHAGSEEYYSYFLQLKQWISGQVKEVVLRDRQGEGKIYRLKNYLDLEEGDFDLIEIYAYYLALFINNMRNGIYIHYLLSFPVNFSENMKEHFRQSFERGIRKSFPEEILHNEKVMKRFNVRLGVSEPTSYAVCALLKLGLKPKNEEDKIVYAIFDCGGNTTDFDFGIFRGPTKAEFEEDGYDYVLECLKSGGDDTLGGENLLELLAFELLKENLEIIHKENLSFSLSYPQKPFLGLEGIVEDSQEAKNNILKLKNALRPYWEGEKELESCLVVELANRFTKKVIVNMQIDLELVSQVLNERIDQGIDNFFQCLLHVSTAKQAQSVEEIHFLLAGNSSYSAKVQERFHIRIEKEKEKMREFGIEKAEESLILHKPLLCKESNIALNAKTGVAYGLLLSKPGSNIKIDLNYDSPKLKVYVGRKRRDKFECILTPDSEYGVWVPFTSAKKDVVYLYSTTKPLAQTNEMNCLEMNYEMIELEDCYENAMVYVRPISPYEIEYVVANKTAIASEEYLEEIKKINLY